MVVLPALQRIHQISIRAHNTARAVTFYRDTLGLKLLFEAPPQLAFFDCGGVRLMLSPPEAEFDHQGSVLYFAVDDIGAAHRALAAAGVTFRTVPHLVA
jgi:methylmalonyl-CoA/ethylmalonyl-CoA epimerase